jgi:hypothetical protein
LERRIFRAVHAEQELHRTWKILLAEARQVAEQDPFVAVQRLDDRTAGKPVGSEVLRAKKRPINAPPSTV